MKYGMNLLLWTSRVGEEQFPLLADLKLMGYDGVEIPVFDHDDAHYHRVAEELESLGLECTTVTVATREANPISPDAAVRQAGLDAIKRAVDTSAILGSRLLCGPIHSALGALVGRGRTEEEWGWCVETLRPAAEHAQSAGVTLGLEYLNRFEAYFLNCAADTRRLVDAIGHPHCRAMYDTFHANIEERDVAGAVGVLAPALAHFHVSENDRSVPGTGQVRWRETFAALDSVGYDGWFTVEAFGRALPELAAATCIWRDLFDDETDLARRALEFMRAR